MPIELAVLTLAAVGHPSIDFKAAAWKVFLVTEPPLASSSSLLLLSSICDNLLLIKMNACQPAEAHL